MSKKKKQIVPLPVLAAGSLVIDTHCHLDMEDYREDLDEVLQQAFSAGIGAVITVGIDLESSEKAVALARSFERVHATVGVHPHNVTGLSEQDYLSLEALAREPGVVAYGEVGLDTVKLHAPLELQLRHFEKQLRLARTLDLPIIIHDRGAHGPVLDILKNAGPLSAGGVMHCFSGDVGFAREIMDLGLLLSIPGVVTFGKSEMLQEVVRYVPLDRLLLETDGPYLAPVPYRGKRNEPLYTLYTAQKVAELKGVSLDEVAARTTRNAREIFRLT